MQYTALRFFILISVVLCSPVLSQKVFAQDKQDKVVVGYFSTESQEDFEKKIKPLFEEFYGKCKNCEILNLTPYDDKGAYSEKDLVAKLKNPEPPVSFYFFSWNKKTTDASKELIATLEEKIRAGQLVISSAGHAAEGETGVPLSRTLMGQTKDAIVIGEVTERERLLPQSYFGPEMLTAIRAPKAYLGQGVSPLYFASRWAAVWSKRKPAEWLQYFKHKKEKTRKIWLETDDLLGR